METAPGPAAAPPKADKPNEGAPPEGGKGGKKGGSTRGRGRYGAGNKRGARPKLKVVVRGLPPDLTEEEFLNEVNEVVSRPIEWSYFCPGEAEASIPRPARAYVTFKTQNELFDFNDKFDSRHFTDRDGNPHEAMVEYAPCQKYPKRKPHEDKLEGTITKDGDYVKFLQVLAAPPAPPVVPTETAPVERKITDIPLLMELIEKKRKIQLAAKARAERGMRSDKMNKSRRDELRRGKDDGKAAPRNSNSKKPLPRPSDDGHSGKGSKKSHKNKDADAKKERELYVPKPRTGGKGHGKGSQQDAKPQPTISIAKKPPSAATPQIKKKQGGQQGSGGLPVPAPKPKPREKKEKGPPKPKEKGKKGKGSGKGGAESKPPPPKYQNFL